MIFYGFFIEFQIPWIWKWDLTLHNIYHYSHHSIILTNNRIFFYKWWKGFDSEKTVEKIQQTISFYKTKFFKEKENLFLSDTSYPELSWDFFSMKVILALVIFDGF